MFYQNATYMELDGTGVFGVATPGAWTTEWLGQSLMRLKRQCAGTELVHLTGPVPTWALCAAAAVIVPSALCLDAADRIGLNRLICTPFPVDAGGSDCGVDVDLHEVGDQALLSVRCDPSRFDFLRFDDIVVPPMTPGLRAVLFGAISPPVAVSMTLSYAPFASSIWMPAGDGAGWDICVASRSAQHAVGDRMTHKIQRERTGQHG